MTEKVGRKRTGKFLVTIWQKRTSARLFGERPLTTQLRAYRDRGHNVRMNCSIRDAGPKDVEAMHNIRLAVRENPLSATSGITAESYAPYLANGSAWVAERNNTIIGFAATDEATASVWALFVAQEAEGTGVGGQLQDAILEWARGRDIARLRLATAPNTRAKNFYAKLGWELIGYDEHGQLRFDRLLDR